MYIYIYIYIYVYIYISAQFQQQQQRAYQRAYQSRTCRNKVETVLLYKKDTTLPSYS